MGFAYPSGHVLAAAVTWGFLPALAGVYLNRHWVRRACEGLAWRVIGLIAWSRVWLGVHWVSDVVGGVCIAFVALALAQVVIDRHDHDVACGNRRPCTTASQFTAIGVPSSGRTRTP
jgi:undecaprenyl-diphosphatase